MTVSTTLRKQPFVLDGVTDEFTFTFRALVSAPTDIKCIATDGDGVDTTLAYTTDYSVAVNTNGIGGTVMLVDAAGVGSGVLTVYRETTNTQGSDYDDYNQFPADTLETDLDIRTLVSQEQAEILDRTLSLSISSIGVSASLPSPVADKLLGWNGDASALENKTFSAEGTLEKASTVDAQAATNDAKYVTPAKVKDYVDTISITLAPATNTDGKVPQWDGADSKTLKDGLAVASGTGNLLRADSDGSQLTNVHKIIQVVNAQTAVEANSGSSANIPNDDTKPTWAEVYNFTGLDAAITPTSTTSTLKIDIYINAGLLGGSNYGICLFQDPTGTDECKFAAIQRTGTGDEGIHPISLTWYVTANTTSATTFKIGAGCIGATTAIGLNETYDGTDVFEGTLISSMTITEIKA